MSKQDHLHPEHLTIAGDIPAFIWRGRGEPAQLGRFDRHSIVWYGNGRSSGSESETAKPPLVDRDTGLMEWSREFTALVLQFAARFATVEGVAQDVALLRATPLYPNFRLGTDFDHAQPIWEDSFPLHPLRLRAPIRYFYRFYGIGKE